VRVHPSFANQPSSPSPFSQNWEKGSEIKVPLPKLGEGFRVRATKVGCTHQVLTRQCWVGFLTRRRFKNRGNSYTTLLSWLKSHKNAVQNAQALYKRHQKLRRARGAIEPLLTDVLTEIHYLEQVEVALGELADYQQPADLETLEEIRDELIQQNYLADSRYRGRSRQTDTTSQPFRYRSPNGLEVLVGRNNRQNDDLTFRISNDYDLWFHTQEIPGSHVLLRLPPGTSPEPLDLQFAADAAAYHSRARQSEQVPGVYTKPRFVYKPKGAKPGMTVYKQEQVIWGSPPRHTQFAMSS